jgi:hypothetical protein
MGKKGWDIFWLSRISVVFWIIMGIRGAGYVLVMDCD